MTMKRQGFSLIEVMVALAILALAVSALLIVRNNAIKEAIKTSELRKIAILVQQKMGELVVGLEKGSSGTFVEEGYRNYLWQTTIRNLSWAIQADGKQYQVPYKEITLVVQDRERKYSQTLVGYFLVENSEDAEQESVKQDPQKQR